tara:strand:- start:14628 stop:15029 length:402 start_codon:yes stop_codon:yes gene_type:complete
MSNKTLQQKVIEQIAWSSAALDKAETALAEKQASEQMYAKLIPAVVDALARNERIEEHEKAAAADMLRDPVKALEILEKVAEHRVEAAVGQLGTPEGAVKSAGYNSLSSPFTGVPTSQEKESDRRFREAILGR